ncbi:hypothetical protein RCL1_005405 [Eukaryota sp. TZLM3-RCL]
MSTSHTQATVITGPQGSSDVPVSHPETAPVGSVPSQQTSSVGSVPSQQGSTSGSVPPEQTSPTEIGSEAEDSTPPPPLLPFPMHPGLRETLDRLAEPFTLPEEPHSSAPSMENILEDPRIQSVLNGLFQWATNNRIPTESIFGESVPSPVPPTRPLSRQDYGTIKESLPPALPRPSSLTADF